MVLTSCLLALLVTVALAEQHGGPLPEQTRVDSGPLILSARSFARQRRSAMAGAAGAHPVVLPVTPPPFIPPANLVPQLLESFPAPTVRRSSSSITAEQASIIHLESVAKDVFTTHANTKQAGAPFDPAFAPSFGQLFNYKAITPGDMGGGGGGGGSGPGGMGGGGGGMGITYGGGP